MQLRVRFRRLGTTPRACRSRADAEGHRLQGMGTDRSRMTARVVPLGSDEATDARVAGTVAERLAILSELSRRMWALTQQPVPSYTRSTMPVKLSTLAEQ
jgi:hypothetical protein